MSPDQSPLQLLSNAVKVHSSSQFPFKHRRIYVRKQSSSNIQRDARDVYPSRSLLSGSNNGKSFPSDQARKVTSFEFYEKEPLPVASPWPNDKARPDVYPAYTNELRRMSTLDGDTTDQASRLGVRRKRSRNPMEKKSRALSMIGNGRGSRSRFPSAFSLASIERIRAEIISRKAGRFVPGVPPSPVAPVRPPPGRTSPRLSIGLDLDTLSRMVAAQRKNRQNRRLAVERLEEIGQDVTEIAGDTYLQGQAVIFRSLDYSLYGLLSPLTLVSGVCCPPIAIVSGDGCRHRQQPQRTFIARNNPLRGLLAPMEKSLQERSALRTVTQ